MSAAATGRTVDGAPSRSTASYPGNTAAPTFAGRARIYRELDDAVARVGAYLISLGLNTGDRVRRTAPTPTHT